MIMRWAYSHLRALDHGLNGKGLKKGGLRIRALNDNINFLVQCTCLN